MPEPSRVTLIDLSSIWWTNYHVGAESGTREPRAMSLASIERIVGDDKRLAVICCDSGRSFRKDISDTYKANREKQPQSAYGELERLKERLRADGYLLWEMSGFEADDIIASACKMALDRGHEVRLASADKDLLQLLGVRVDALRTHTWQVVTSRDFLEQFKIDPSQMRDFLALVGDKSDNIDGCDGIGKVRAAELLTKYESLDRIYEALDAGKTVSTPANEKSLRECKAKVELARQLVSLRTDLPLDFNQLYEERKPLPLTTNSDTPPPETDEDPAEVVPVSVAATSSPEASAERGQGGENVQTALVPVVEYARQLEPRSMSHAVWLGRHLYDSRLYSRFPSPEAITAIILRGRELGLGAATALDVFHIIEGRPVAYAYLIIARAKQHRDCEYFQCIDASPKSATWETKNRNNPKPTRVTYTFDQAVAAKLVKPNSAWEKHPEDQVVKTAGAKLARREYPDAALGLYAVVEMGEDDEEAR